jgi:hypothetical protein
MDVSDSARLESEPLILHPQANIIPSFKNRQLMLATRHLPGQEVARRLELAFVDADICGIAVDALWDWVQAGGVTATATAEQSAVMEEINHNARLG